MPTQVSVEICLANNRGSGGKVFEVASDAPAVAADMLNDVSSSAQSTACPDDGQAYFWVVNVTGGAVRRAVGTNPTAVANTGPFWGEGEYHRAATPGFRWAFIDFAAS